MSIKRFMMFAFCAFIAVTLISGCSSSAAKKDVKYVFVLIGDGFGPNQRIVGEQASGKTLAMNTLPCSVPTGTNNVNGDVTDSAASGTAIACGVKTYNGAIGVDANKGRLTSLAKNLKEKGMSIGIISSCAITDATPAAQYAQQENRSQRKIIAVDMAASKFDFFGGGNMASCAEAIVKGNKGEDDLRNIVAPAYEIVYDINEVKANSEKPYYLINPPHTCWTTCKDNCEGVDLAQILAKSIDVLSTNEKGFYIMLECGRIDHAGHANDAAFTAREVSELDQALAVALDFQKKYPEETLIIVTADHETGGLQIDDMEKLKANAPILLKQKGTIASGSAYVDSLINQKMKSEDIYKAICSYIGYDGFSAEEKAKLIAQIATNYDDKAQSVKGSQIFKQAVKYRDAFLGLRYTTGGHSAAKILTNVTGPGWENFKREDLENSSLKALIEQSMELN